MAALEQKQYVIIGNGIAGTTAAQTLRKNDPNCSIFLITDEPYPLYNRVSLPRFLQGVLTEQKVMIRNLEWHEQQGITLLTETSATAIDTEGHAVTFQDGRTLPYTALLVATGGRANPLTVPGAAGTRFIFNFVTLDDTKAIIERALESRCAVTTGGSFIGYEMTEGFNVRKLHVTWLIRGPRWLRTVLDEEGGALVDDIARRHGVEVVHGEEIREVVADQGVPKQVITTSGKTYDADVVGVGLGITLSTGILRDTPVACKSGIIVNEYLETNVPGVYSAGDVAEFYDPVIERHHTMGTWDNAMAHGRIAGINMAGGHEPYIDVPTYTSPLFDTNIAVIGTAESNNPELTSISRTMIDERGERNYRKFFFRGNRLVGSVFVGSPKGRKKIVEIIRVGQEFATQAEREGLFDVR
ncbi:MAG TPA: FAD-dependent oxidoreductase [Ktedonobacterales bacterium]|nr:FAD-dependent oxidoreductase [Ktedonobacterales bacterium]